MFKKIIGFATGLDGWVYAILAGVIALAVTAAIAYHYYTVSNLQETIATQAKTITDQKVDINQHENNERALGVVIDSQQASINALKADIETSQKEAEDAARLQGKLSSELDALRTKLADQGRQRRELDIRNGAKASLLLRTYNDNVECQLAHFTDTSGQCTAGRWVVNR